MSNQLELKQVLQAALKRQELIKGRVEKVITNYNPVDDILFEDKCSKYDLGKKKRKKKNRFKGTATM